MTPIGPDPDPHTTDPNRVVDLIREVHDEMTPDPVAEPPEPQPTGVSLFEVDGTVFNKGNFSVSFRAPNAAVFQNPDAAIVLTSLQPAFFDQFVIGRVFKIEFKTTP